MNSSHINNLRAERLYYTLEYDLNKGIQHFKESIQQYPHLENLLTNEVRGYVPQLDTDEQVNLYLRLAQLERDQSHYSQAVQYSEKVINLGKKRKHFDWQIEGLISAHESIYKQQPETSLKKYLFPAEKIAKKRQPLEIARIQYEIGLTFRHMHKVDESIEWYTKARETAITQNVSKRLMATINNDLGYVYTFKGDYKKSEGFVKVALSLRREHLREIEKEIETQQQYIVGSDAEGEIKKRLIELEFERSRAYLRIGFSHNTLGQIYRYQDQFDTAIYHYDLAFSIFEQEGRYWWQIEALISRGEAFRRLALKKLELEDMFWSNQYRANAQKDIERALYLCDRHRIDDQKDTTHRRMGRWWHDEALRTKDKEPIEAEEYLKKAQQHFNEGLYWADRTNDILEKFENLTELAFTVDDLVEVTKHTNDSNYEALITQLTKEIHSHRKERNYIHQLPVFENLLKLEEGAFAFVKGNYPLALKNYLEGFTGLAISQGYGAARYRHHLNHLQGQILKISDIHIAKSWCEAFIQAWNETVIPGSSRPLTEEYPDLYIWCTQHKADRSIHIAMG